MPLLLLSVILFVGKIGSQIDYHNFENWPTKILQILFDYPAILFFSISTIFIDELFFRSFLYKLFREHIGIGKAIVLSSIFWSIFNLSGFIFIVPNTIEIATVYIPYYLSTGILLSVLVEKYGHILYGYLFRVGLMSFSALLLSNATDDQSTFFVSNSLIFSSQGIIFSILSVFLAFFFYRDIRNNVSKMQDFEHFS
jgi:membrane protease YdiL (CAAX protease family)